MGFRFGPPRVSGFELFRDGHPIAAELEPLLRRVAADPVLRGVARPGGPRPAIRRDLRAGPDEDGAPSRRAGVAPLGAPPEALDRGM